MGKKKDITPEIKAAIIRSTGDEEFDFSKISVFEATALNTLPVSKRGLFDGAVTAENTLRQMASYVSTGSKNAVPLHLIHDTEQMQVGRVFNAAVVPDPETGVPNLQAEFYIGNHHEKLVADVDLGTIDEVSVGLRSVHLNCSQCGFDFLGADATMDHIWTATCANEHTMGVDGAHVILNGMDRWMELSLVPLGAGKNPKILSRTKSLLGKESYETLAASGIAPELTSFYATHKQKPITKPEPKMEIKDLVTLNADLSGRIAVANHQVTTLTASVATLTTENTDLKAKLATAEAAAKDKPEVAAIQVKLTAAETALAASTAVLSKEADRLCVVLKLDKLAETATIEELTASIDANRAKVKETFTPTVTEDTGAKAASKATSAAFKTAR